MKKLALFLSVSAFALTGSLVSAAPWDNDRETGRRDRGDYREADGLRPVAQPWNRRLAREVRQMNRYHDHVRDKIRLYRATPRQWREFRSISLDVRRVNDRFRYSYFSPDELRGRVNFIRMRLQRLERSLNFRRGDVFIWGSLG